MISKIIKSAVISSVLLAPMANATILTVFDGVAAGQQNFESTVTAAGGTSTVSVWDSSVSGSSYDFGDYVVSNVDGGSMSSSNFNNVSGNYMVSIDPNGPGSNPRSAPSDYISGGIQFVFDSAINAIGFEVEDWATCCFDPTTDLFISFDSGTPIQVATASQQSDGQFPSVVNPGNTVYEIFVAAFDDSGSFNTVTFWGNGVGEVLYAGGQVRYSLLDTGSLPPSVSEPSTIALLSLALAGFGYRRFKRN